MLWRAAGVAFAGVEVSRSCAFVIDPRPVGAWRPGSRELLGDASPGDAFVVLGLPRGGVPVGYEVAAALGVPLDVILVRKLGLPSQPELAMGAIGEDGVRVVNDEVVRYERVSPAAFAAVEATEREELERRARRFRGARRRVALEGRTALIVDDGIATGSTARAACQVARAHGAAHVILATPIAPPGAVERLVVDADEVIVLDSPEHFGSIGEFYDDFRQLTDDEVIEILIRASRIATTAPDGHGSPDRDEEVTVRCADVALAGDLLMPAASRALVLFAHGSGSSRRSPRNRFVAEVLNRAGVGTLLFDLLTPDEELERANVFDIELLGGRLAEATEWVQGEVRVPDLALGYFGASTGAGAALWAAAESAVPAPVPASVQAPVRAIVSRGGRPDLAGSRLEMVRAPTLLIVGGADAQVLDLNRRAARACAARPSSPWYRTRRTSSRSRERWSARPRSRRTGSCAT